MMQKTNMPHGSVQRPTERMPFFSKFKQKIALGLALLTVGQLAAPVAFRKISPFAENAIVRAEEKKEELKSILEREAPHTFTVKEGDMEVTFTNSSCVLDVIYKEKKFSLDIKEKSNKKNNEKMEFFHCYEAVVFPEYPTVAVIGTYKDEGKTAKTGVFIIGKKFGMIKEIVDGAVKIEKLNSERIKVTNSTGFNMIFSALTGEYLSEETVKANLDGTEK